MKEKKPRKTELLLDFGKPQAITGVRVGLDGVVVVYGEDGKSVQPEHVQLGAAYDRSKGPKTLIRASGLPGNMQVDPNKALAGFDFAIAVDTNTETVGELKVSMTVAAMVRNIRIERDRWSAQLIQQDAFEFHDATEPPEIIGWCDVIRRVQGCAAVSGRVALIVDSDLGRHQDFSKRRKPLLGDFYLPDNMVLVYASSERGREYIANTAIADCDKTAKGLLQWVKSGGITVAPVRAENAPYRCYRYWRAPGQGR